jgi:hypothetical protein
VAGYVPSLQVHGYFENVSNMAENDERHGPPCGKILLLIITTMNGLR